MSAGNPAFSSVCDRIAAGLKSATPIFLFFFLRTPHPQRAPNPPKGGIRVASWGVEGGAARNLKSPSRNPGLRGYAVVKNSLSWPPTLALYSFK
jgi:hypothetical protein